MLLFIVARKYLVAIATMSTALFTGICLEGIGCRNKRKDIERKGGMERNDEVERQKE